MELCKRILEELRTANLPVRQNHKRLNHLVREIVDNKLDPSTLIHSIQSADFWSRKLQFSIAEKCLQPNIIIDFLRTDEKRFINCVLKLDWMFKEDSLLANPKYLTNDLFPYISCLCRRKILRRISNHTRNISICENLFEAINETYGLESAQCLLPSCGHDFIYSVVSTQKLILTSQQLVIILDKFPEIAVKYMETFFKNKQCNGPTTLPSFVVSTDCYNLTLHRLARKHSQHFMNIYEEFSDVISGLLLSCRATNRLLRFNPQRILNNSRIYSKVFNKEFLQRKMSSEQFEEFFSGLLPDTLQHFRRNTNDYLQWLTTFSPRRKGELLKLGFQKAYALQLEDRIDCIASNIVQFLLPDERMKIAEHKLAQTIFDECDPVNQTSIDYYESSPKHYESFWTAFKTIDVSIPKIKELLTTESDASLRSEMIVQLVRTCSINEHKIALAGICKYVADRHRNENTQVSVDFLEALDQNFDMLDLDSTHWDSIREVIHLCLLESDLTRYSFVLNDILEKAFIYFTKNSLPVKSILPALVQLKTDITWGTEWRMETLRKKEYRLVEKSFLELAAQHLETKYSIDDSFHDSKRTKSLLALASCFREWNKICQSTDKLSFKNYPWMLEQLMDLLDSDDHADITSVYQILTSDPFLERETLVDALLRNNPTEEAILYLMRHDPNKLSTTIASITKFILRSNLKHYKLLLRNIRCFGPKSISGHFIRVCRRTAEDAKEGIQERGNSIVLLSQLQSSDEFIKFIPQFYPIGSKIEIESEYMETRVQLVRSVLESLPNLEFPSLGFPVLLQLCKGDYLKYSLGALYSLCLHSSVEKGLSFLKELVDRPVSIKKHAIRLFCLLSPRKDVSSFMKQLWNTENNVTIRQEVMKQLFIIISSSASIWPFMASVLKSLSHKEKACLGEITKIENVEKVPSSLLAEYFLLCKEVYSRDSSLKILKVSLLQVIGRNKHRLGTEFLENLICSEIFLKEQEYQVQQQVVQLAIGYLLSASSHAQSSCLKTIQQSFTRFDFAKLFSTEGSNRNLFGFFIEQLCVLSFDRYYERQNFVELFSRLQESECFAKFKAETFSQFAFVQFALIFHSLKSSDSALEQTGGRIGDILDVHVAEHGKEVVGLFSYLLQAFLRQCSKYKCSSPEQLLKLIQGLIRPSDASSGVARKIVALQLFPSNIPCRNVQESFQDLAHEVQSCNDTVVTMYAYNCIKF